MASEHAETTTRRKRCTTEELSDSVVCVLCTVEFIQHTVQTL